MLSQDKIGYADIFFKAIFFVQQVTKRQTRSCVAVHRKRATKSREHHSSLGHAWTERRKYTFMLVCNTPTQFKTHARHVHMNAARVDVRF